jgi:hypothetical protein
MSKFDFFDRSDAGRQMFPALVQAQKLDAAKIEWVTMNAPLRETMLFRGEVDAITGFITSGIFSLRALGAKDEDEETRDSWWLELRAEVKSNAAALACSHVVGYKESCSINGDVCLLSCIGTAVQFATQRPRTTSRPTLSAVKGLSDFSTLSFSSRIASASLVLGGSIAIMVSSCNAWFWIMSRSAPVPS